MAFFRRFSSSAARYISHSDNSRIVDAIRTAETRTSGEVRVFFESRCRFVNPIDRAAEVFFGLQMDRTDHRNGVLVYVAFKDRQFAIFADEGIYREMGTDYWNAEAGKMLSSFAKNDYVEGIITVIHDIGEALQSHFPYDQKGDKNELPDDIVFGK